MEKARVAVLSNVNMNMVIRMLKKEAEVYEAEGYGNELGILMNPASSYYSFAPEYTFLVMDLMELLAHDLEKEDAGARIGKWFSTLEHTLCGETVYYVSDAYLYGAELEVLIDCGRKVALEQLWQQELEALCERYANVRILPYRHLVEQLGEAAAFSAKMWYLGRVLLSNEAQRRLCGLLLDRLGAERRTPKKLLLLDLDNTLWGGLAGEHEITPIVLSEEHSGLAYKNLQRVLLQMRRQGVLLAIVSKNNEQDALRLIEEHPHMVLRRDAFVAMRINWQQKHENIREIAKELNLGTDSFVFWDDNPTERELVRKLLPEVTVPEFPDRPEELAAAMAEIYSRYFKKPVITAEDREKTAQYAANAARRRVEKSALSFEEYLEQLGIVVTRVSPGKHLERLAQLVNKTNQFNLTTRRYTRKQLAELLEDEKKKVYLYSVADRFGDNGVVVAVIVDLKEAVVEEFVMSCRVMGKRIEYAVMEDVEQDLHRLGLKSLTGVYIPTGKNRPVAELYDRLGYRRLPMQTDGVGSDSVASDNVPAATDAVVPDSTRSETAAQQRYVLELSEAPTRSYRATLRRTEQ